MNRVCINLLECFTAVSLYDPVVHFSSVLDATREMMLLERREAEAFPSILQDDVLVEVVAGIYIQRDEVGGFD